MKKITFLILFLISISVGATENTLLGRYAVVLGFNHESKCFGDVDIDNRPAHIYIYDSLLPLIGVDISKRRSSAGCNIEATKFNYSSIFDVEGKYQEIKKAVDKIDGMVINSSRGPLTFYAKIVTLNVNVKGFYNNRKIGTLYLKPFEIKNFNSRKMISDIFVKPFPNFERDVCVSYLKDFYNTYASHLNEDLDEQLDMLKEDGGTIGMHDYTTPLDENGNEIKDFQIELVSTLSGWWPLWGKNCFAD